MADDFKSKASKQVYLSTDNKMSISLRHQNKLKYYEDLQKVVLPRLKIRLCEFDTELQQLIIQYQRITHSDSSSISIETYQSNGLLYQINKTKKKKDDVQKLIYEIVDRKEEKEYIEKTDYIFAKLEILGGEKTMNDTMEYSANNQFLKSVNDDNKELYDKKHDLIIEYLHMLDTSYNDNVKKLNKTCNYCGGEFILNHLREHYVCKECGVNSDTPYIVETLEGLNYADRQNVDLVHKCDYERINHFMDWLSRIQAKEKVRISDQTLNAIYYEIKKEKLKTEDLQFKDIKRILKKMNLNKLYKHGYQIIYKLNNMPPPQITIQMEEQFRTMFIEMQAPYDKWKHLSNRKSFHNYSYVLRQFCVLLEYDHLLIYFPLLKSRDKLHEQDKIFKKVCEELSWAFYPTV